MFETTGRDRGFKTVILVCLAFSIMLQILVSSWFYDKLKTLENHLSQYPVNKPVEVDLNVTVPELVEIDKKIDKLNQYLTKGVTPRKTSSVTKTSAESEIPAKPPTEEPKPRRSHQVDVIEKIAN
jgi:hypothetical protein